MRNRTLTVYGNVGVVTGDLKHPGDVRIYGSILPGHRVEAGGGLFVAREVRGACAFAGGDLLVNGLVWEHGTHLDAVGSVKVRQIADARVVAGEDIVVRSVAERCDLSAGRRILVTGAPGVIHGGTARAGISVEANRIARSAGKGAVVVVGQSPFSETTDDLEQRINFARQRGSMSGASIADTAEAIRREVASDHAYAQLLATVERRLEQVRIAGEVIDSPSIRVAGRGVVWADVTIGKVEEALVCSPVMLQGAFEAVLTGEGIELRALRETTCVG
jgi:uncharacterized protein (DUF342 family)